MAIIDTNITLAGNTHKQRVFAGRDDTICLRFKDREEWLSLGFENVEEI